MYDKDPLCLVMSKEQLDLIGRQKQLIKRTGDRSIIDCSLCGTITKLIK
jgi:hypothetical protein